MMQQERFILPDGRYGRAPSNGLIAFENEASAKACTTDEILA